MAGNFKGPGANTMTAPESLIARRSPWLLAALIAVLVAAGAIAFGCAPTNSSESSAPTGSAGQSTAQQTAIVPNVTGSTLEEARKTLADTGLKPLVARDPSDSVASGTVSAQLPEAGASAAPGSGVGIAVSTGPVGEDSVLVPDVVGTPLGEARGALVEQGFEPVPVPESPDPAAGDLVTKQYPGPAEQAQQGASVLLLHTQE
jgi:hypothetical protein